MKKEKLEKKYYGVTKKEISDALKKIENGDYGVGEEYDEGEYLRALDEFRATYGAYLDEYNRSDPDSTVYYGDYEEEEEEEEK